MIKPVKNTHLPIQRLKTHVAPDFPLNTVFANDLTTLAEFARYALEAGKETSSDEWAAARWVSCAGVGAPSTSWTHERTKVGSEIKRRISKMVAKSIS